jgi:hypothetical protein
MGYHVLRIVESVLVSHERYRLVDNASPLRKRLQVKALKVLESICVSVCLVALVERYQLRKRKSLTRRISDHVPCARE